MPKAERKRRKASGTLVDKLRSAFEENLSETLGKRLRELRRQQGSSLRALADESGLSANTLSLIENGKTSPSVSTLQHISIALHIPITAFFECKVEREPIVFTQHGQRNRTKFLHGMLEELGSIAGRVGLQPLLIHFEPASESGPQPLTNEGQEFFYCLAGQVNYTVAGKVFTLEPGDSLYFSAKIPHSWCNPLEESSTVLIVIANFDEPG